MLILYSVTLLALTPFLSTLISHFSVTGTKRDTHTLDEESFILACGFQRTQSWLAGSKVKTA